MLKVNTRPHPSKTDVGYPLLPDPCPGHGHEVVLTDEDDRCLFCSRMPIPVHPAAPKVEVAA